MARVFLAGAGYVGTVAARLLREAGHAVDIGRRSARDEPGPHAMDVLRPGTYPAALGEAECVVYCVSADGFTEDAYRDAYVSGLSNVIAAAAKGREARSAACLRASASRGASSPWCWPRRQRTSRRCRVSTTRAHSRNSMN